MTVLPGRVPGVLFDAAGTLFSQDPPVRDLVVKILRDAGFPCATDEISTGISHVESHYGVPDDQPTATARVEAWTRHCQLILEVAGMTSPRVPARALARAAAEVITDPSSYRVLPGIPQLLTMLKLADVRVGIVSNFDDLLFDILAHTGLNYYFRVVINSFRFGAYKPDPSIFVHAAHEIGVDPRDTYMVGDSPYSDMEGARRAGMHGVLFDPGNYHSAFEGDRITEPQQLANLLGLSLRLNK